MQGYRTYICAALAALVTILYALQVIDQDTWQKLMGILVAGGAAALRAAVDKVG